MQQTISPTRVVGIASGKGGVGKTTISVNAALELCRMGYSVALLDADLGLANSQILLGINAPLNLGHVVDGAKEIRDVAVEGPLGLILIPGASGNEALANINPTQAKSLVAGILTSFPELDILLIDSAAGLSTANMSFLDTCDYRVVVMQDEPASIADAYGLIKLESRKDRLADLYVVPNRVAAERDGQVLFDKMNRVCMQFLEEPIHYLSSILQDDLLGQVTRRRETVIVNHPSSKAATNFNRFAEQLVNLFKSSEEAVSPSL